MARGPPDVDYHNLSQPTYAMSHDDDVDVPMRDGVMLMADVHRPRSPVNIRC
jgi:uncharacterized protein